MVHPSYVDSTQFTTRYLSSAFALGFAALEQEFCFVDLLSNAKTEICSSNA